MEKETDLLQGAKKTDVGPMFDSIAWRYDFLNHLLSFGTDRVWRKKAIRSIGEKYHNPVILDVATGTGDLAIAAMKLNPAKIYGIDISGQMLEIGREKIARKGYAGRIELLSGNSENIQFPDTCFDVAMVAFGVRNFANPLAGLTEMCRVIRTGGMVIVLEFSKPAGFPFRQIYNFYFRNLLPYFGKLFSKDRTAYRYLHDSVMQFPDNEDFITLMNRAGFKKVQQARLTWGVASIYTGFKE